MRTPLAVVFVATARAVVACGGDTGNPPAPAVLESTGDDASPAAADATTAPPDPTIEVVGAVIGKGSTDPVRGALVVVEVGGLDVGARDGGADATLRIDASFALDTAVRYVALTDDAGAFGLNVPEGAVGLHVFDPAYREALVRTRATSGEAGADAAVKLPKVSLVSLGSPEAGSHLDAAASFERPTLHGLNAAATYGAPSTSLWFAADVEASPSDPLSEDVFLVEPTTGFAKACSAPLAAVPGGAYPNGVYSVLVALPSVPGAYTYTMVAASLGRVPSLPASITVTVTASGDPPVPDGGYPSDGAFFVEGGGLPDGRH